jgi:hypothetical protein
LKDLKISVMQNLFNAKLDNLRLLNSQATTSHWRYLRE